MSECEPCDLCCVLAAVEKNVTIIQDGESVEHTCHKLFWRCNCPSGVLTMQWQSGFLAEWEDIIDWTPSGERYYYPCPSQANGTFRLKCSIGDTVFYSNTITLSGTTTLDDCHCTDGEFAYVYQIEIDITFEPDGGDLSSTPPYSTGYSGTYVYYVPRVNAPSEYEEGDPFFGPIGFNSVLTGYAHILPCGRSSGLGVDIVSGVKPVSYGGDGEVTVSRYELNATGLEPCVSLPNCVTGVMSLVETNTTGHHPIYHGGQESIVSSDSYNGYCTINEVRARIALC